MRMSDQTLYDYELQGKPAIELPLNAPVVRQVFDIFDRIIVKPCKKIGIDAAVFLYKMATCMPELYHIQRTAPFSCSVPDQRGNPPGCKTSFLRLCSSIF
jgi:hypothetical protein